MPKKHFFPKEPVIPSRVTDCLYISYHGKMETSDYKLINEYTKDDSEDRDEVSLLRPFVRATENMQNVKKTKKINILEETYIGQWMLFYNNGRVPVERGMTEHDYKWQFAKKLVDDSENTFITSVIASTGNPYPYGIDPSFENGVICCFTKDYRNRLEVKKAAEAIRKILHYRRCLFFYKTDETTFSGHYRYFAHKLVSLYQFCPDNKFYERDQQIVDQWNHVEIET